MRMVRYTPKFIVKTSLIAIVCGFIVGYTLFQSQNILRGPIITVTHSASEYENGIAVIEGKAQNIAFLSFNDRRIYTDTDGVWKEKMVLSEGYNVVKLSAQDKFGRTVDKTIELMYEEPAGGHDMTLTAHNSISYDGKTNN